MKYINLLMMSLLLVLTLAVFVGCIFVAFNIGGDEIPSLIRGVAVFGAVALGFLSFVAIKDVIVKEIQEIRGKRGSW